MTGRNQRTPDDWRFTKPVYEIRYLNTTPLAGSAPTDRRPRVNPAYRETTEERTQWSYQDN